VAIEQMLWYYAKGKPKDVIELEGHLDISALNRMSDTIRRASVRTPSRDGRTGARRE
jgi:hypothetical protein